MSENKNKIHFSPFYWSIQMEIERLKTEVHTLETGSNNNDVSTKILILVKLSTAQSLKRVIDGVEE